MTETLKKYFPGVAIAITMAVLAHFLSPYIPYMGSVMLALIFGAIAGNTFMNGELCAPGIKFTEKKVLEAAIVLIGFGLEAHHLQTMGGSIMGLLAVSVFAVLGMAYVLGKVFKSSNGLSFLLGAGSAICGSSAIAATAPIVDADEEETGLSLAIINVLGIVGLVALPALAHFIDFNDLQTATLLGSVLQSLGHVVASGYAMGDEVGEWAVVVKMGRILFMVPLLLALYFIKRNSAEGSKAKFPVFIALFVASIILAQLNWLPAGWNSALDNVGDALLTVAMAAIGSKIKIKPLLKISGKGILQGVALFVFQIVLATVLITFVMGQ